MNKTFDRTRHRGDAGYALVFVLFLMAVVIIGASTAAFDQLTEGRREKEAVMIWRAKQYQRAIGLFYKKFGRFPTSLDDLVKAQNGEERFLREAYKNPMNKDGKWRFIYVTPAGQLIGSVQYVSLQQMAFIDQQRRLGLLSGAAASPAAQQSMFPGAGVGADNSNIFGSNSGPLSATTTLGGNPGPPGQSGAANPQVSQQFQPPSLSQSGQQSGSSSFFTQPGANQSNGLNVQESSSDSSDNGQVIGGFIIGVAGTQEKPSIKVYKGGATYKRWEFIFNPLEQVQTIGTVSSAPSNLNLGAYGTCTTGSPCNSAPQAPQPPPQTPQQPQIPQQPQ